MKLILPIKIIVCLVKFCQIFARCLVVVILYMHSVILVLNENLLLVRTSDKSTFPVLKLNSFADLFHLSVILQILKKE